jgi:hypothetical protein
MTAKEMLRRAVEDLSEAEAAEALELIARRTERDALRLISSRLTVSPP